MVILTIYSVEFKHTGTQAQLWTWLRCTATFKTTCGYNSLSFPNTNSSTWLNRSAVDKFSMLGFYQTIRQALSHLGT